MSKELIAYLKLIHGSYNTIVMLLFLYQGILGFKIRKHDARSIQAIKRHRRNGPIIAVLGIAGFMAGITIILLDTGHFFRYHLHFIGGFTIAILIAATYLVSLKIKGPDSYWRNIHYVIGLLIICSYLFQVFSGFGLLL